MAVSQVKIVEKPLENSIFKVSLEISTLLLSEWTDQGTSFPFKLPFGVVYRCKY